MAMKGLRTALATHPMFHYQVCGQVGHCSVMSNNLSVRNKQCLRDFGRTIPGSHLAGCQRVASILFSTGLANLSVSTETA